MHKTLSNVKDAVVMWGSFLLFVCVEVALIYGLFRLTGVI